MSAKRPVFLDLWRIKLPATGIVSILHRFSGLLMVVTVPVAAALLALSLSGADGFARAVAILDHWLAKTALVLLAWALAHHLFAGIRLLLLDIGIGLDRPVARASAWTSTAAALAAVLIGGGVILL
ncbi:succinate dehydrogenase, cytochrome b556 subunit [Thioflavicoccus mobilis 8321]|uniref:Succinate dehydrogenase cytochrome b556 subunit n=1 Tax=Thioflavicoccus mobilis 8321 TaxID=765912 RepID=L0GU24_9GAMM|nr:succinate dehydrogenase, cytochrome b556 subunit [Thioflavicoccus mobilis]AGA89322.1 succinate dehydrogenase, cytochrome b556 subunit [Thioflavicoccus mobilis 8321]